MAESSQLRSVRIQGTFLENGLKVKHFVMVCTMLQAICWFVCADPTSLDFFCRKFKFRESGMVPAIFDDFNFEANDTKSSKPMIYDTPIYLMEFGSACSCLGGLSAGIVWPLYLNSFIIFCRVIFNGIQFSEAKEIISSVPTLHFSILTAFHLFTLVCEGVVIYQHKKLGARILNTFRSSQRSLRGQIRGQVRVGDEENEGIPLVHTGRSYFNRANYPLQNPQLPPRGHHHGPPPYSSSRQGNSMTRMNPRMNVDPLYSAGTSGLNPRMNVDPLYSAGTSGMNPRMNLDPLYGGGNVGGAHCSTGAESNQSPPSNSQVDSNAVQNQQRGPENDYDELSGGQENGEVEEFQNDNNIQVSTPPQSRFKKLVGIVEVMSSAAKNLKANFSNFKES